MTNWRNYTPGQERQSAILPTHIPGPVQNVRDPQFGAIGDGTTDDTAAIQAAMDTGGTGATIYFPGGTYLITTALRPEYDEQTIQMSQNTLLKVGADVQAILVNKNDPGGGVGPESVHRLRIVGGRIDVTDGHGPADGGVVQLNNCTDVYVESLYIRGDSALTGTALVDGKKTNGIATSQGTWGTFVDVVVDTVSKPGIYISSGSRHMRLISCEARNITGYYVSGTLVEAPGIAIAGGANVDLVACNSHNNSGNGMQITTTAVIWNGSAWVADSTTGTPASLVRIFGGVYRDNLETGILFGANTTQGIPDHVEIIGAQVYSNDEMGIDVARGWYVAISECQVYANGTIGIRVSDNESTFIAVAHVHVLGNIVYNNGQTTGAAGIYLRGGQYIYCRNNEVFDSGGATQLYGIQTVNGGDGNPPAPCHITGNHAYGNATANYQWTAALANGHVDIVHAGAPAFAAPIGSVYKRTDGGAGTTFYVKEATGTAWAAK